MREDHTGLISGRVGRLRMALAAPLFSCLAATGATGQTQVGGGAVQRPPSVFTSTAEIRALSQAEASRGYQARLHAVVTYYDPGTECFVQDATGGIWVDVQKDGDLHLAPGQLVEVTGRTDKGLAANQLVTPTFRVLGRGTLPRPKRPTYEEFASGQMDTQWIEMEGIVRSAQLDSGSKNLVLSLAAGGGRIRVEVHHYPEGTGEELVDARVRIRGACGIISNSKQQTIGVVIYTPDYVLVRIREPGTQVARVSLVESINELTRLTPRTTSGHRVKVRGVVTLRTPFHSLYIADKTESILVETRQQTALEPGDIAEIAGFPVVGRGSPRLEDALVRALSRGLPPSPVSVSAAQAMEGQYESTLVCIEGRVFELDNEDNLPTLIMEAGNVAFQARVLGAEAPAVLARLRLGSRIRVTGICELQTDQDGTPQAFRVLVGSPGDLTVLEKASWWTPVRTGQALALMAAAMFLAAGWVYLLRRQVNRQAELLRRETAAQGAIAKRFEFVARATNDALWEVDLARGTIWASPVYLEQYGPLSPQIPGDPTAFAEGVHPQDREKVLRTLATALRASATKWEAEHRQRRSDASYASVYSRAYIERDEAGKPLRLIGAATDITARKRAEEALAEEATRRQMLVEQSKDGVVVLDQDGKVYDANRSFAAMLGYTPAEVRELHVRDWNPLWREQDLAEDSAVSSSPGRTFETLHRRKDGSLLEVEVSASRTEQGGSVYHFRVVRDISERKKTEQRLRLQAAALQAAANGIVITDPEGIILWANPGFSALTGYVAEEAVGRNPRFLKSGEHDQAFYRDLWLTIRAGKVWRGEISNRRKDGTLYVEEMTIAPVRDEAGTITNYIAIKQDITRRKQVEAELRAALALLAEEVAERTRAEAEVVALSHRLINAQEEERTRLARELHDDVSQQIAVLGIGLSNIKRHIPPRRKQGQEEAERAFLRLKQLAEDIRRLSHQLHPAMLEHSGLAVALESYCEEFKQVAGVDAVVRARGRLDDLPAQPALGVLRIAQEALQNVWKHAGTKQVRIYLVRSRHNVRLRISDDGVGFDSTRGAKGDGLGLVSMRERARLLGGTFRIKSALRRGTTIIATIPLAASPTRTSPPAKPLAIAATSI